MSTCWQISSFLAEHADTACCEDPFVVRRRRSSTPPPAPCVGVPCYSQHITMIPVQHRCSCTAVPNHSADTALRPHTDLSAVLPIHGARARARRARLPRPPRSGSGMSTRVAQPRDEARAQQLGRRRDVRMGACVLSLDHRLHDAFFLHLPPYPLNACSPDRASSPCSLTTARSIYNSVTRYLVVKIGKCRADPH